MTPSTTGRRAGMVAAGALAISLGGALPVSALTVGSITCPSGQILNALGKCVTNTVSSVPLPLPTGSSSGGGSTGGTSVPVPLPTGSLPRLGGSGGSSGGSGGLSLPGLPSGHLPSGGTSGTGSLPGTTMPGGGSSPSAAGDPGTVPGASPAGPETGLLSQASAFMPASGILGFSSLSGSGLGANLPSSGNLGGQIPSPLLADMPASRLAAVQAPLVAAGDEAGRRGTVLAAFGGTALPGLLVILATAVVAVVGAGNIRVWQARLALRQQAPTTS